MKRTVVVTLIVLLSSSVARGDQVILDDLIIDGSLCVGTDCVNGESFGFDTIRLKENNLRIKFEDTSASASFPSNDWQITINDSANGGLDKFSIDDITGGKTPFTIEAGAPNHSLYVDDAGRLGLGTSQPVVDAHVVSGNTPTLRLEQDGSSGFTAQTWDVAGNEANFFVRDTTNGSLLPFRIQPSAPSNSLFVKSNGDVGIGTASPSASLHVHGDILSLSSDSSAQMVVKETSSTTQLRNLMQLINNGAVTMFFQNTDPEPNVQWDLTLQAPTEFFSISKAGSGVFEMKLFPGGNLEIGGLLTENSDVTTKENITPVDGHLVLAKLDNLPISTWNYKRDESGGRHLGPMAQDFFKAFGLGNNERRIASLDMAGVALVGVQELQQKLQEKDTRITVLEARIATLESMIKTLVPQHSH